jgi:hypothetical protein
MQRKNLSKELSRYKISTWVDIIYRNATIVTVKIIVFESRGVNIWLSLNILRKAKSAYL